MKTKILFLSALLLLASCKVYEKLPTVSFRGPTLQGVQTALDLEDIKVNLGLRFLFRNPLKKDIVIPEHQFTLKIDGRPLPFNVQRKASFTLAAESQKMVVYAFTFDLDPNGPLKDLQVLGKDSYYEFETKVELDLKALGIKIPTALGKLPLKKHELEFSIGDTIRLPLLPEVKPAAQMASVRFLGTMETFNLEPIKDAMAPMVDIFLDATFDSELTDPFVDLLLNSTVDVLLPTASPPFFKNQSINLGDHIVDNLLKPLHPDADDLWDDFKTKMKPGQVNMMDHLVGNFLEPINSQADENWAQFKQKWQQFKNSELNFQYPGPGVTGLQIEVPFVIHNPNSFPIQAPSVFATAAEGNYEPLGFQAIPTTNGTIAGGADQQMKLFLTLDWSNGNQSLLDFMQGQSFQPRLKGRTSIDMGYDLMEVEIDIPLNLQSFSQN